MREWTNSGAQQSVLLYVKSETRRVTLSDSFQGLNADPQKILRFGVSAEGNLIEVAQSNIKYTCAKHLIS